MTCCEIRLGPSINDPNLRIEILDIFCGEKRHVGHRERLFAIDVGRSHVLVVGGIGDKRGQLAGDKALLVGICQDGVRGPLLTDRRRVVSRVRCGAKASLTVSWVEPYIISQLGQAVDRSVLQASETVGAFGSKKIGAAGRSNQETSTRKDGYRFTVDQHEIGDMLGRVAWRVNWSDSEGVAVDVLEVKRGAVPVGGGGAGGKDQLGTGGSGEVAASRYVVVVEMGLEDKPEIDFIVGQNLLEAVDVSLRINNQAQTLVAQDVGRIAETLGADAGDFHVSPGGPVPSCLPPGSQSSSHSWPGRSRPAGSVLPCGRPRATAYRYPVHLSAR